MVKGNRWVGKKQNELLDGLMNVCCVTQRTGLHITEVRNIHKFLVFLSLVLMVLITEVGSFYSLRYLTSLHHQVASRDR